MLHFLNHTSGINIYNGNYNYDGNSEWEGKIRDKITPEIFQIKSMGLAIAKN